MRSVAMGQTDSCTAAINLFDHLVGGMSAGLRTDRHEKVLEKLATSDKVTIVIERQPNGKMRVTSGSWVGEKVILRDQVLEVRNVDNRLHVARKERRRTSGTRPMSPMTPMAQPDSHDFDVIT
jgi:hypothetical protein